MAIRGHGFVIISAILSPHTMRYFLSLRHNRGVS